MTRSTQRFTIALIVLAVNAGLLAALVYMAIHDKHVSGENILYMAVGSAMTWATGALQYYFGSSESSAHKTEVMERQAGEEVQ